MSKDKYFIFKLSDSDEFIGRDITPLEERVKNVRGPLYGIKYDGNLPGKCDFKTKDSEGNDLCICENSAVSDIRSFHENYKEFTSYVSLVKTNSNFSKCVDQAIKDYKSGATVKSTPKKTTPKKTTTKKKSTKKKGGRALITGGKRSKKKPKKKKSSKKGGKKKSSKKKSYKRHK